MLGKDRAVVRRTYARYAQATHPQMGLFAADMCAAIALSALVSFGNPYVMALIIDRVSAGSVAPDAVLSTFGPYIAALVAINVLGQFCSKFVDYATWKLQIGANYRLATLCFDTLSNQSMTFHTSRFGGSLVSQTTRFMNAYAMLLENLIYGLVPIACAAVFTLAILVPRVPVYVAILFFLLVLYVILAWRMYDSMLPLNRSAASSYNKLFGVLSDSLTNILAVKTYGRERHERELFDVANENVLATDSKRMWASTLRGMAVAGVILAMTIALAIFVTGGNAWLGIAPGTLVMMFTYTYTLTTQFDRIGMMLQQTNRALGDAHEMTKILDEPRLVDDVADAVELQVGSGDIVFDSLVFAYGESEGGKESQERDGKSEKGSEGVQGADGGTESGTTGGREGAAPGEGQDRAQRVFDGFTLRIPAGQRVGLVGPSGSGKTSLTKLLLRLSDLQGGSIRIDGQDIAHVTQESLRHQIAYVPQEALLFHRSIRENIAYGRPDATDDEVRAAAEQACALEFIDKLPNGLDTEVGELGATLSGGQRQRIAIARAILADCPILVLDEATSALDSENEQLVQDALANLMCGRTSIVVAHRLSTVAMLDRIIVLDDGRIIEDGTHAQLLEAGGTYARLWERQTGAFLDME